MRVLFDENMDRRLRELVDPAHAVVTVVERGWGGVTNGELLARAEHQFDVLVTMDQNLEHQQNLSDFDLAIVVIKAKSNRPSDVNPAMTHVNEALQRAQPGEITEVTA